MKQIILEGITGSGKSSNTEFIKDYFEKKDYSVAIADCTSPFFDHARDVRQTLKDSGDPLIPQLLMHQLSNYVKILEAKESDILLVDRHIISPLVYTLAKAELSNTPIDLQKIREHNLYPLGLNPLENSTILYFDVDPLVARERTHKREQKTIEGYVRNNFDLEFQSMAAKYYEQELPLLNCPVFILDANQKPNMVENTLENILGEIVQQYKK